MTEATEQLGILDRSPRGQFLLLCKLGLHPQAHLRRCTGCYWSLERLSRPIIELSLRTQDRDPRTWTGEYQQEGALEPGQESTSRKEPQKCPKKHSQSITRLSSDPDQASSSHPAKVARSLPNTRDLYDNTFYMTTGQEIGNFKK